MKPAYLDHIGIAVKADLLGESFGLWFANHRPRASGTRKGRYAVDSLAAATELLHPTAPESTIQKFLDKSGRDGIHHLSFRVENIREVSERLTQAGFKLIYPAAQNRVLTIAS